MLLASPLCWTPGMEDQRSQRRLKVSSYPGVFLQSADIFEIITWSVRPQLVHEARPKGFKCERKYHPHSLTGL